MVGEGVEVLVATDHNFITDYAPTIEQMGLQELGHIDDRIRVDHP